MSDDKFINKVSREVTMADLQKTFGENNWNLDCSNNTLTINDSGRKLSAKQILDEIAAKRAK